MADPDKSVVVAEAARRGHDAYEAHARSVGHVSGSPVPWDEVPEPYRGSTLAGYGAALAPVLTEVQRLRSIIAGTDGETADALAERDQARAEVGRLREERGVCACRIHESGRGLSPCTAHDRRIAEHQAMYQALKSLGDGRVTDVERTAELALQDVHYWHRDHPRSGAAESTGKAGAS